MHLGQKNNQTKFTVLALAAILVLSAAIAGSAQNSFAVTSSPTTVTKRVLNSNELTINSLTISVTSASSSNTKSVTIDIVQNGHVVGSTNLDLRNANIQSRSYKEVTLVFRPSVQVDDDFDIIVRGRGVAAHTYTDSHNTNPGYLIENGKPVPTKDLDLLINGQRVADAIADAAEEQDNSGEDSGSTDTSGENTSGSGGEGTSGQTVKLLVNAKDQNGKPVVGMWVAVLQGFTTMVDKGWTEKTFTLTKDGQYTVYMDDYTDGTTTWTFMGWADSQQHKFRDATLAKDETFTAIYNVQGPGSSGGSSGDTGYSGGSGNSGGTGDNTGDNGGTTTAGANQVAVNSQLLSGTTITGMAVELREAANGHIAQNAFTPATLDMQPGIEYKAIMYPFTDTYFRHWTDGGLHRYHLVDTAHNGGDTLTAQYERVPASQAAHLMINAKTSGGQPIGGTTGSEEDQNLNAEPGLEVLVAPPGSMNAYTAGFTGGSEIAQAFYFTKGQTYTVVVQEFGHYKFSHWEDNGSTNRARAVALNGDLTLTAIYDIVS